MLCKSAGVNFISQGMKGLVVGVGTHDTSNGDSLGSEEHTSLYLGAMPHHAKSVL